MQITRCINEKLGFDLTDSFCGFKAYSRRGLQNLPVTETGYAKRFLPLKVTFNGETCPQPRVRRALRGNFVGVARSLALNVNELSFSSR